MHVNENTDPKKKDTNNSNSDIIKQKHEIKHNLKTQYSTIQ